MLVDFHLHTEFSDDSVTPMEQQIESAIEHGLSEICFTDHVDYGIKKDWDEEGIRFHAGLDNYPAGAVTNVNYPEYFGKILRMRVLYGDKIALRAGLELGVQRHTMERNRLLAEKYREQLDFLLLSVHEIDDQLFWNREFMQGRTQEAYNLRYYEELAFLAAHFDEYDVLAHADLVSRYDPAGPYPFEKIRDPLADVFRTVIARGKGIEINTSSWRYHLPDTTPTRDILRLYRDLGGKILTMGSDAHTPSGVGDHMQEAQTILKELGFREFYTYTRREPVAHPL